MTQTIHFNNLRRASQAAEVIFVRAAMAASGGDVAELKSDNGAYELEFKIGGKDVDFMKFCAAFEEMYEAELKAAADQRLDEISKFRKLREALEELESTVERKVRDLIDAVDMDNQA